MAALLDWLPLIIGGLLALCGGMLGTAARRDRERNAQPRLLRLDGGPQGGILMLPAAAVGPDDDEDNADIPNPRLPVEDRNGYWMVPDGDRGTAYIGRDKVFAHELAKALDRVDPLPGRAERVNVSDVRELPQEGATELVAQMVALAVEERLANTFAVPPPVTVRFHGGQREYTCLECKQPWARGPADCPACGPRRTTRNVWASS